MDADVAIAMRVGYIEPKDFPDDDQRYAVWLEAFSGTASESDLEPETVEEAIHKAIGYRAVRWHRLSRIRTKELTFGWLYGARLPRPARAARREGPSLEEELPGVAELRRLRWSLET